MTVAPGYFYRHERWPEQGEIRLAPESWTYWLATRPLVWVVLGSLCLLLAYRRAWAHRLGDYQILELLGEGGFSKVYRAQGPQGPVALKLLRAGAAPHCGPAADHAGIVQTYYRGQLQGQDCVVMELVSGGTLRNHLSPGGLPLPRVAQWLGQLLEALSFAHGQGVVHADLKPENVLLTLDGQVKLTDFAGPDGPRGTPAYMAPEQLLGQPVGEWTDQYGLALLAYEMLTGNLPVGALARGLQPLPPASRQRGDLDVRLDGVMERMLQVCPQDRYPCLEEAGRALLEAL